MKRLISSHRVLAAIVACALAAGCAEASRDGALGPETPVDAYLEVADSAPAVGERLLVLVKVSGARANNLGSFTGRVTYDTTALEFIGEPALNDGVMRVSNPMPGVIRTAAIRAQGFGGAPLAAYEFRVRSGGATSALSLTVQELHDVKLGDAGLNVRLLPTRLIR